MKRETNTFKVEIVMFIEILIETISLEMDKCKSKKCRFGIGGSFYLIGLLKGISDLPYCQNKLIYV